MKVLNFGSLNIDYVYCLDHFVQKGETISSQSMHTFSGGKGLNQSIAMGRAGITTYHAGAVGKDGDFLIELLQEAGVHTELIRELSQVRTGNAIIQKDKNGENCIILYGGANQEITKEQVDETLKCFEPGDYLVLQNEINEGSYIMEQAHKKGMVIVLNPSPMDDRVLEMPLEYVNYFILNEVEAGQILNDSASGEVQGEALAKRLREKFPGAKIVLTLGEKGSVFVDDKTVIQQQAYRVETVDTTAAGDTFTGYFIAGLIQGLGVEGAMDQGAKASAIAVSSLGAAPSIPMLEQVKQAVF